jgi:hypothetical protein
MPPADDDFSAAAYLKAKKAEAAKLAEQQTRN